uniref:Uncharacterized protein n=1 Tax=Anopheles coluzzii TaxID=1518534 RepID=A0A8W7PVW8_ANOCL
MDGESLCPVCVQAVQLSTRRTNPRQAPLISGAVRFDAGHVHAQLIFGEDSPICSRAEARLKQRDDTAANVPSHGDGEGVAQITSITPDTLSSAENKLFIPFDTPEAEVITMICMRASLPIELLNSTQLVPVDNIDIVGRRVSRDPYPRA